MKAQKLASLLLAAMCTVLASCTDNNESVTVFDVSLSEPISSVGIEMSEQTVGGAAVGNTLMAKASPDTSALLFSVYDGETVKNLWLFSFSQEKEILNVISAVPAEKAMNWSPELFTAPAYGFHIGDTYGGALEAVWSNGYWITQDGEAYSFDFDFGAFSDKYDWSDESVSSAAAALPCAYIICRNGDKWYADRLSPPYTDEEEAPDYISAELVEQTEGTVTIKYTNNGSEDWLYGLHFSLDVLLNGEWYSVPTITGNWAFDDIGLILNPEQQQERAYSLWMYGELPPRQYRIAANGCIVEFTIL